MIITTKNGDMVDTIQIIEDNVYKSKMLNTRLKLICIYPPLYR